VSELAFASSVDHGRTVNLPQAGLAGRILNRRQKDSSQVSERKNVVVVTVLDVLHASGGSITVSGARRADRQRAGNPRIRGPWEASQ
jgi:hypothetical protein